MRASAGSENTRKNCDSKTTTSDVWGGDPARLEAPDAGPQRRRDRQALVFRGADRARRSPAPRGERVPKPLPRRRFGFLVFLGEDSSLPRLDSFRHSAQNFLVPPGDSSLPRLHSFRYLIRTHPRRGPGGSGIGTSFFFVLPGTWRHHARFPQGRQWRAGIFGTPGGVWG